MFGFGRKKEVQPDEFELARSRLGTPAERSEDWATAYGYEALVAAISSGDDAVLQDPGESLLWYVGAPEGMLPLHPDRKQAKALDEAYRASVEMMREIAMSQEVFDPRDHL